MVSVRVASFSVFSVSVQAGRKYGINFVDHIHSPVGLLMLLSRYLACGSEIHFYSPDRGIWWMLVWGQLMSFKKQETTFLVLTLILCKHFHISICIYSSLLHLCFLLFHFRYKSGWLLPLLAKLHRTVFWPAPGSCFLCWSWLAAILGWTKHCSSEPAALALLGQHVCWSRTWRRVVEAADHWHRSLGSRQLSPITAEEAERTCSLSYSWLYPSGGLDFANILFSALFIILPLKSAFVRIRLCLSVFVRLTPIFICLYQSAISVQLLCRTETS